MEQFQNQMATGLNYTVDVALSPWFPLFLCQANEIKAEGNLTVFSEGVGEGEWGHIPNLNLFLLLQSLCESLKLKVETTKCIHFGLLSF